MCKRDSKNFKSHKTDNGQPKKTAVKQCPNSILRPGDK